MKIIFFLLFFPLSVHTKVLLTCETHKHVGLNFFGNDFNEILDHVKLKKFDIKLTSTRKKIFEREKKKLKKNVPLKTSHFIEIVLIRSSGYAIPMHCSWIFDVRNDQISQRDFNCIGYPKNDRILSLDYNGNFMFSSKFDEFFPNKRNQTLHSLLGICK